MRKPYAAPALTVDEYVQDTLIASGAPKNGNAFNNQNCWWCHSKIGEEVPNNHGGVDACWYICANYSSYVPSDDGSKNVYC